MLFTAAEIRLVEIHIQETWHQYCRRVVDTEKFDCDHLYARGETHKDDCCDHPKSCHPPELPSLHEHDMWVIIKAKMELA